MTVQVQLLGRFEVRRDGAPISAFPRRDAASLVKVLALTPGHRLPSERAIDVLWPDLLVGEARPRLHKAAHFARRVLGARDGVTLDGDWVALLPDSDVVVDVEQFEAAAVEALGRPAENRAAACAAAADLCGGELLPEDQFEAWAQEPRDRVRARRLELLRAAGRWTAVLGLEPADELAHLELIRQAVVAGDRVEALRRHERMTAALADLGIDPRPEATALRDRALSLEPARLPVSAAQPGPTRARPGRRPGLLERDAELRRLEDRVDATIASRRGVVVLVTGEAGSGKTVLLEELTRRVADRLTVLAAGCDDLLAPRSLGPFRDIARDAPGPLADAFAAGGDPHVVLPALLDVLAARPVLLAIEDVHWADDATVDAVRFLGRRICTLPSIILLTCRDELGRTHPLRRVLGSLSRPQLERMALGPLSAAAVAELAGGRADPERLHRVTRGNPFFVTEVLAAGGRGVPATVRDAVLARVAGISADAQELIQRLAVVPSRVDRSTAEYLTCDGSAPLLEAERAGIIVGDARYLWFRHEIARAAVVSTLTPGELRAAHRKVLEALLCERAPDLARVVHHAQAAGRSGALVRFGPAAAADAARAGAFRQAADTLRVVLEAGTRLPPERLARLLADRSAVLYSLNRFEEAFAGATAAVAHADETADPLLQVDAHLAVSKAGFWARGPLSARHAAERAVALLGDDGEDERRAAALACLARAHSNLATLGIVAEPGAQSAGYARRALDLAARVNSIELRCQSLFYLGSARLADGDESGAVDLERSVELAAGDAHATLRIRACVNAAGSAYRFGSFAAAERYVTVGLELAEPREFDAGHYRLRLTRAAMRASAGRWDEAVGELRDLLAAPGEPGAMGLMTRCLLARLLGRRGAPEAEAVLAAAVPPPEAEHEIFVHGPLAAAAVELAWLRGDLAAMPGLAADALRLADEVGHRGSRSELLRYLQRAGHTAAAPADAVGPWAAGLAGHPPASAAAWAALGDRYEEAVERSLSGDSEERRAGLRALQRLGATATVAAVTGRAGPEDAVRTSPDPVPSPRPGTTPRPRRDTAPTVR